jgi:FixJ family two-component response regulator
MNGGPHTTASKLLLRGHANAATVSAEQNRSERQTVRLIGIVDDDEAVREAISSLLRSAGLATLQFASAEAFLSSARMNDVECLILDVRMSGLSGIDLQERLNQMHSRIPIIFATAHPDDEIRRTALTQGASAFFVKPVTDALLLPAIRDSLALSSTNSPHPVS